MHIKDTPERDNRMRRLLEATGESTKSKAVDAAIQHYLRDLRNKKRVVPRLQDELAEELSTSGIPIERETSVGRD